MGEVLSATVPAVVLVRPQEQGNVGAAARAMANMGLEELVLVEPAVELGPVARAFAVGAGHVLDGCRRAPSLARALAPYRRVVATSSGRGRRPGTPLLPPRELPALLAGDPPGTAAALVFGPESSGLGVEELALASAVVRVPCAPRQPTLNLAQAVLILSYELYLHRLSDAGEGEAGGEPAAPTAEVEGLFGHATEVLRASGFDRDDTFPGVLRDLRHFLARARPTEREVRVLRGACRRVLRRLERRTGNDRLPYSIATPGGEEEP